MLLKCYVTGCYLDSKATQSFQAALHRRTYDAHMDASSPPVQACAYQ